MSSFFQKVVLIQFPKYVLNLFYCYFCFALDAKAQVNNNEDNKIYSLDEINADLLSRKKRIRRI